MTLKRVGAHRCFAAVAALVADIMRRHNIGLAICTAVGFGDEMFSGCMPAGIAG
jgi:hypothetical protein